MVFKLVTAAAKIWRRLKGENQLPKVVHGVKFQNGMQFGLPGFACSSSIATLQNSWAFKPSPRFQKLCRQAGATFWSLHALPVRKEVRCSLTN